MTDQANNPEPLAAEGRGRQIGLLALGHFLGDGFAVFHTPLMPLLAVTLGFNKQMAGLAVLLHTLTANLAQPLTGYLSERYGRKLFLVVGIAITIVSMSCLGLVGSYAGMVGIMLTAGVGLSLFHPAGASLMGAVQGEHRGLYIACFTSAGALGLVIGTVSIGRLADTLGMRMMPWAMVVGAILLLPILLFMRDEHGRGRGRAPAATGPARWGPFLLLALQMTVRTAAFLGFATYLPFYCREVLGMSLSGSSRMVAYLLLFATVGNLLGGRLSDRFSRRFVMVWPLLISPVFLVGFLVLDGPLALACLTLGAVLLSAGHPVNVVLGQEYLPSNTAMASGVMIGATFSLSSLPLPLLGWIIDRHSITLALLILFLTLPLLGGILAMFQPQTERAAAQESA